MGRESVTLPPGLTHFYGPGTPGRADRQPTTSSRQPAVVRGPGRGRYRPRVPARPEPARSAHRPRPPCLWLNQVPTHRQLAAKPARRAGETRTRPPHTGPQPSTGKGVHAWPPIPRGRPLASKTGWSAPSQGWSEAESPQATRPQGAPFTRAAEARHWLRSEWPNGHVSRSARFDSGYTDPPPQPTVPVRLQC